MKQLQTIFTVFLLSALMVACSEDDSNTETDDNNNVNGNSSISLDEVSEGEGAYSITGDAEFAGSGSATHYNNASMEQNGTTFSVQTVEIDDVENEVVVIIDFYIIDPEADAFGGKLPESGTYKVYEPGLTTPDSDYAKVNVYGDGLESFFTTDEESELELSVRSDGIWEASFSNVLDDYETDEVITLQCAFKASVE